MSYSNSVSTQSGVLRYPERVPCPGPFTTNPNKGCEEIFPAKDNKELEVVKKELSTTKARVKVLENQTPIIVVNSDVSAIASSSSEANSASKATAIVPESKTVADTPKKELAINTNTFNYYEPFYLSMLFSGVEKEKTDTEKSLVTEAKPAAKEKGKKIFNTKEEIEAAINTFKNIQEQKNKAATTAAKDEAASTSKKSTTQSVFVPLLLPPFVLEGKKAAASEAVALTTSAETLRELPTGLSGIKAEADPGATSENRRHEIITLKANKATDKIEFFEDENNNPAMKVNEELKTIGDYFTTGELQTLDSGTTIQGFAAGAKEGMDGPSLEITNPVTKEKIILAISDYDNTSSETIKKWHIQTGIPE
jgi:hypothetical protein